MLNFNVGSFGWSFRDLIYHLMVKLSSSVDLGTSYLHNSKNQRERIMNEHLVSCAVHFAYTEAASSFIWLGISWESCASLHHTSQYDSWRWETGGYSEDNLDLNEPPSTMTVEAPEFSPEDYVTFERVLEKDADIRDISTHKQLKKDLVEHIWQRSRASRNISWVCDIIYVIYFIYLCPSKQSLWYHIYNIFYIYVISYI